MPVKAIITYDTLEETACREEKRTPVTLAKAIRNSLRQNLDEMACPLCGEKLEIGESSEGTLGLACHHCGMRVGLGVMILETQGGKEEK